MQSGRIRDEKHWVEQEIFAKGHSRHHPQLLTKTLDEESARVQSPAPYHQKIIEHAAPRSWLYLLIMVLACISVSRKIPSWLDTLTRHPEHTTSHLSIDQDVQSLPVLATSLSSNNPTNEVEWDEYSLLLHGQRVFLQ